MSEAATTPTPEEAAAPADPIPVFDAEPVKKPKYFVAGNTFFAQMEDGWELQAPVKLSVRNVKKIQSLDPDADELDQLVRLFELLGNTEVVDKLMDADFLDSMQTAMAYFQAWEEKNEARLGELQRSSRS